MKPPFTIVFSLGILFNLLYFTVTAQNAPQKTFTEKLEGISTSSKELTKSASTDNSSVGQSGVMSTSVPLVTVSSKTMQFPLQLNYTSGIKVDQQSGPVGLGWAMPVGSITRDYGAFQPDYSSTLHEGDMWNVEYKEYLANGGNPNQWYDFKQGWLNPNGDKINPTTHNHALGYNIVPEEERQVPSSDFYRVSVPNLGSNSFFNISAIGGNHNWTLTENDNWKIEHTVKTYEIDQEYSRINEINLGTPYYGDKNNFDIQGSYAAAIGILPYVKNGFAELVELSGINKVRYEDFKEFIITDANGTQYVFGRALRGQKYIFQEDPYWSASSDVNYYNSYNNNPPANPGAGNFWKTDFIAEWLLTEIRSADYVDVNQNGIADDEDQGDWIRFVYTDAEQEVTTVPIGSGNFYYSTVPKHREWSSFSQTDQSSSLMRERAYLTHIITPTQKLDFTISQRYDVEHDYLAKPANKHANEYYYENRKSAYSNGSISDFDIRFPIETMKYDKIDVYSRLIDQFNYPSENLLTGSIVFNYAEKGSAQELAVSEYLIRNNNNTPKLEQNGTHLGAPSNSTFNIESYKDGINKRGKTTLLSLDFFGGDLEVTEKTAYKFEYAYNPSYNEIHKREIVRKWSSPSLRQSGIGINNKSYFSFPYTEHLIGSNGLPNGSQIHSSLKADEFLIDIPYNELTYKLNFPNQSAIDSYVNGLNATALNYEIIPTPIAHPLKPLKDVYGFLYSESCTECPKAWSLTKIIYPTGGEIVFEYEQGEFAKSVDEPEWSFGANEVPIVKEYNELAKHRSYVQDAYSRSSSNGVGPNNRQKTLTATFEVDLPEKYGIRLKNKTVNDKINPIVTTNYTYGTGHFTSAPSEYVQTIVGSFNQFVKRERERHSWEDIYYGADDSYTYDYDEKMRYLAVTGLALDEYVSNHFYESTSEVLADDSKIKHYFAPLDDSTIVSYDSYNLLCYNLGQTPFDGGFILARNNLDLLPIMQLKTEYFESGASLPYKSIKNFYKRIKFNNYVFKVDYTEGLNVPNTVILWDQAFEFFLPTPLPFGGGNFLGTLPNPQITNTFSLPYNGIQVFEYERWAQYKTTLTSRVTNYKGLETSTEYEYNAFYNIEKEITQGFSTPEKYITVYEYGIETYLTSEFFNKNIYNAITRTTTYLDNVNNLNVFSAQMTTYDVTSFDVPRPKNSYTYETSSLNSDGTFNLVPFDISSTSNPNWRIAQQENLEYNKHGMLISSKTNQLYNKTVLGNNLNIPKASFSFPDYKFDATYTGFEDLYGKNGFTQWDPLSYKDEKWFTVTENVEVNSFMSYMYNIDICENGTGWTEFGSNFYHLLSVDDVQDVSIGSEIEITFTHNNITTIYNTEIADIILKSEAELLGNVWAPTLDYLLCFTDPVDFVFTNPANNGSEFPLLYNIPGDPNSGNANEHTLNVLVKNIEYSLNKSYRRTGKYSCQLRTKRNGNEEYKQTPVRPVKTYANFSSTCITEAPIEGPNGQIYYPPAPEHCYYNYEASVWLQYNNDISKTPAEIIIRKSSDGLGDAIYRRGNVTETDNGSKIKIVCDVYNEARTQLIEKFVFYPEAVNGAWKQYTVNFDVNKQTNKWIDVYVVNEREQLQLTKNYKSLFVDDLLIYPKGAKYSYSTYDKFGSPTFVTDNNDVFVESVFDQKGRPVSQKNAYGSVVSQADYFENPNWTYQNNYITSTSWVDNGDFSKTRHYLDGFGKTKQVITADPSRGLRIVSETNVYDSKGQVIRSFKPYVLSGANFSQRFNFVFEAETQDLYGTNYAYTQAIYEQKPEPILSSMSVPRMNNETAITSSQVDYVSTSELQNVSLGYDFQVGELLVHEVTNADGNKTRTYMDNLGRVVMEEHQIGKTHVQNANGTISIDGLSPDEYAKTWFQYDKAGRITDVWDPEGKHSHYKYNSLGVVVESTTPDKGRSKMNYDKYGQIRFVQNEKDIQASALNGMSQFKFLKYDVWGRIIESGILISNQACTTCPTTDFFNDITSINNQSFPLESSKLVQIHLKNEYDGERNQFESNHLLSETAYSTHQLQGNYTYANAKVDTKEYTYMADGQLAEIAYEFDGLVGQHKFSPVYNGMRMPIGKQYSHPSQPAYNFSWETEIDNFGRVKENSTLHNSVSTVTSQYYYDPLGNILMKGLGTTGNSADPHIDYMTFRHNIRDQIVNNQSKTLRIGLTYSPSGNITSQRWNNEHFDGTTSVNQYDYYYDKMNRLIGADYKSGSYIQNPFSNFDDLVTDIPNDFLCGVNSKLFADYMNPHNDSIKKDIKSPRGKAAIDAMNYMNILKSFIQTQNVDYSTMDETQKTQFYDDFLLTLQRNNLNASSYELYKADKLQDSIHIDSLQNNVFTTEMLKYTRALVKGIPGSVYQDCNPNLNATVYGFLPTFPNPSTLTNNAPYKYDAAYWYEDNGNITELHRNDQNGVRETQEYTYNNSTNNRLDAVNWLTENVSASYQYDATGNLLTDPRNGVTAIEYISYNDMPQSITNEGGTKTYRYDGSGSRVAKQNSPTDINYYLDGVVLNADGEVESYQTSDGYAVPYDNAGVITLDYFYYLTDWLGTVRGVLDDTGATLNANDHYPFGLRLPGRAFFSSTAEGERYQFTGHEFDGETNYEYHGARYYNRELGRYMNVDPLAQQFFAWSSYNYTMGNPINMIDPTGMGPEDWVENLNTGEIHWSSDVNADTDVAPEGYKYHKPGYVYEGTKMQNGETAITDNVMLLDNGKWKWASNHLVESEASVSDSKNNENLNLEYFLGSADQSSKLSSSLNTSGYLYEKGAMACHSPAGCMYETMEQQGWNFFGGQMFSLSLSLATGFTLSPFSVATKGVTSLEKTSGSYLLEFQSGKFYAGKGLESRMMQSVNRIETTFGDKLLNKSFYPATNSKAAFLNEHNLMMQFGGPKSFNPLSPTYNKIFSPGRKLGGF